MRAQTFATTDAAVPPARFAALVRREFCAEAAQNTARRESARRSLLAPQLLAAPAGRLDSPVHQVDEPSISHQHGERRRGGTVG